MIGNSSSEDLPGLVWEALKQRVCADPKNAKRCVMVSEEDFRVAWTSVLENNANQLKFPVTS